MPTDQGPVTPDLRARLLAASCAVLAERGLRGFSVAEVARREGVSSGAPYRHFRSREHLLAEVAAHAAQSMEAAIRAAVQESGADQVARFAAATGAAASSAVIAGTGFDVIFAPGLDSSAELDAARASLINLLLGLATEAGASDADSLVSAQIALAHGYSDLFRNRAPSGHVAGEVRDRVERAARALATSWRDSG
jgi:AcrR family transcriptional regulator